jgi:pimeloyl-ACP methyl ester carboxylesterase
MKRDFKVFKTEEGRRKILSWYGSLLESVNFTYRERYVGTTFGKTYVLEAGDPDGPAVVLIHGSCSNSAAWFRDIPILAEQYHVYSVDIVGDAGNSEETRLEPATDDFPNWLKEVFDGLSLAKASLIGNSLGGWTSLQFAVRFPERVDKLVLIAPGGIVPTRPSFVFRTILYLMSGKKGRNAISGMIFGKDEVPEEVLYFTNMVWENFNPLSGKLPHLTDAQMKKLTMPVLYIAGENDAVLDTGKSVRKLRKIVPHAEVHVIQDNGHVVLETMKWVVPFLNK